MPTPPPASRSVIWLAGISIGMAMLMLAARLPFQISLQEPLQQKSFGPEGEALYSIWKTVHGHPIYADMLSQPFSGSYFNWAFYKLFALTHLIPAQLSSIDDAWIPTTSKLTALALYLLLFVSFYRLLKGREKAVDPSTPVQPGLCAGYVALFLASPLALQLSLAIRPDVGASLFTVLGLLAIAPELRGPRLPLARAQVLRTLAAASCFAIAWLFKPTFVAGITAACLACLIRRDLGRLAILAGVQFALYLACFTLGPEHYAQNLFSNRLQPFSFSPVNPLKACIMWPVIPLACLLLLARLRTGFSRVSPDLLPTLLLTVALPFNTVSSLKEGAGPYYFLESAIASFWLLYPIVAQLTPFKGVASILPAKRLSLVFFGLVLVVNGVFFIKEVTSQSPDSPFTRDFHRRTAALENTLQSHPKPVLVRGTYWHNLPWITHNERAEDHFVYAFVYHDLVDSGYEHRDGGIGALVEQGHFGTIVYPSSYPVDEPSFGADLKKSGYVLSEEDADFSYFRLARHPSQR